MKKYIILNKVIEIDIETEEDIAVQAEQKFLEILLHDQEIDFLEINAGDKIGFDTFYLKMKYLA